MPGLALRLPSAAMRPILQAAPSVGDEPVEDPESPVWPSSQGKRGSGHSVRREKFFLAHESSARIHDVYEVEMRPLGEGSFGIVYRARMRGARDVVRAVKAVRKRSIAAESMCRAEINILRRLDHPHICRLLETFEEAKIMYLVMEYVDGQELFDFIQESMLNDEELDERFAARVMRQVWGALHYCHERKVVHRDLKPENIMIQNGSGAPEIKIIDFGLAVLSKGRKSPGNSNALAGTYAYMAPEARQGTAHPPSDCWSSGMVLHALLMGGLPSESIRAGDEVLVLNEDYDDVSHGAKELMCGLLQIDPLKRLTAAEALEADWAQGGAGSFKSQKFDQSMKSLAAFHRSTMLQRAVLTALSIQMTGKHLGDLREQFLRIDKDRNGHISREELISMAAGSTEATTEVLEWVDNVFDSVDTDGSNEIEYTEWLAAALQGDRERAEQAILAAFRVFDVDGSGKVDQKEIARVITQSPTDIAKLMPEFDSDGDGELNLEEFRNMMLGNNGKEPTQRDSMISRLSRQSLVSHGRVAPREVPSVCGDSGPRREEDRLGSVRQCGRVLQI